MKLRARNSPAQGCLDANILSVSPGHAIGVGAKAQDKHVLHSLWSRHACDMRPTSWGYLLGKTVWSIHNKISEISVCPYSRYGGYLPIHQLAGDHNPSRNMLTSPDV